MKKLELKYGCNPNQKPASVYMKDNSELPFTVLNGSPGYINLLDALNAYQLVSQIKLATGLVAATSFKHVSPTSAAIGRILSPQLKKACFVDDIVDLDKSLLACAYARARGADRLSSFGDFIALSDECDLITAKLISREVSDGIIAPGYSDEALEVLKSKKKGNYCILQVDKNYVPHPVETRTVFGVTFEQNINDFKVDDSTFKDIVSTNKSLTDEAKLNLTIGLITLKYTQSNSVCFTYDGQAIGVGAGQQSRIHCTRLAGSKADNWLLRQSPAILNLPFKKDLKRADIDNVIDLYLGEQYLDVVSEKNWPKYFEKPVKPFTRLDKVAYLQTVKGVCCASDAFFPFSDNIDRCALSGVSYVVEPGGSIRDDLVIQQADKYNMVLVFNHNRLFHH